MSPVDTVALVSEIGIHCLFGNAGVVIASPSAIVPVIVAVSVVTQTASQGPSVIAPLVCCRIVVIVALTRALPPAVNRFSTPANPAISCLAHERDLDTKIRIARRARRC